MANGLWPSLCQSGLAANIPVGVDNFPANTFCFFYATDTNTLYLWNGTAFIAQSGLAATVSYSLTATGSTQGGALALTSRKNVVGTCGTTGAGVALPSGSTVPLGATFYVWNNGAKPLTVYPAVGSSDTIDANLANTGATLTNAKVCEFTLVGAAVGGTGATWASGPQGGLTA